MSLSLNLIVDAVGTFLLFGALQSKYMISPPVNSSEFDPSRRLRYLARASVPVAPVGEGQDVTHSPEKAETCKTNRPIISVPCVS